MDNIGYMYIPSGCKSGNTTCRLHVALHGCMQGRWNLGEVYARNTGYNEVAELNNIIIVYPQAIPIKTNPLGCWDVMGFTGDHYATKNAKQVLAIWRMVEKFAFTSDGVAPRLVFRMLVYMSVVFSAAVMWLLHGSAA